MLTNVKALISKHFSKHITLYFVIILCFSAGIASGVFSVKALSQIQKDQLVDYLVLSLKDTLIGGNLDNNQVFWYSVQNNFKTVLFVWIVAVSVIGFPLIFLAIGIRGFILGFTVGFLIQNVGYKGILFSIVSILPQNLIYIPILMVICVVSINYSVFLIRNKKVKYVRNQKFRTFLKYSLLVLSISVLLLFGSLVEGYLSPVFLKGMIDYIM